MGSVVMRASGQQQDVADFAVRGAQHVWYDAAVMFVFLLLAARMLEQRARSVASAQVDALARARPAFATRERGDGGRDTVPLAALRPGDVACVAAGESVPADGRLLDGDFAAGAESLATALFDEDDIPWPELAFGSVARCLTAYFADRRAGRFRFHEENLAPDEGY